MKTILPIALSAVLLSFGIAAADELDDLRNYCKPDIERLCPGVPVLGGKLKECLKTHEKQISVGCAEALKKLKDG